MTGRERILKALKCEEVDRVPWLPFVGVHGAQLLGITATEYLQSGEKIVAGINAAIARYQPDGIPVAFDLQIEAEALGCELVWADENPPAVASHPLANGVTLDQLRVPAADAGRIGVVLKAARVLRQAHPDIALYGLITGPFTLALHLLGTDIFMKMFDEPEHVHQGHRVLPHVAQAMAGYYLDAGCDVVAVVDPMTSQIGPDQFREFVTPGISPVFEAIRKQGGLSSFFVCGHAQQNIEAMCECRPGQHLGRREHPAGVRPRRLPRAGHQLRRQPAAHHRAAAGHPGRRPAQRPRLPGDRRQARLHPRPRLRPALRHAAGEPRGRHQARARPLPASGHLLAHRRQAGRGPARHARLRPEGRVIVDIITLDSEACAPCQYMVDAVRSVAPEFEGIVEWREHKIKYRESLVFMTSLMVRNVPTICIDGKITFVSRIPPRDELVAAIQTRINEKFRMKIQRRRASLYVLGDGGDQMPRVARARRARRG